VAARQNPERMLRQMGNRWCAECDFFRFFAVFLHCFSVFFVAFRVFSLVISRFFPVKCVILARLLRIQFQRSEFFGVRRPVCCGCGNMMILLIFLVRFGALRIFAAEHWQEDSGTDAKRVDFRPDTMFT
jgi:hypothetical protein